MELVNVVYCQAGKTCIQIYKKKKLLLSISFALFSAVYTTDVAQDSATLIGCQMELTWSEENRQEGWMTPGFSGVPKVTNFCVYVIFICSLIK